MDLSDLPQFTSWKDEDDMLQPSFKWVYYSEVNKFLKKKKLNHKIINSWLLISNNGGQEVMGLHSKC